MYIFLPSSLLRYPRLSTLWIGVSSMIMLFYHLPLQQIDALVTPLCMQLHSVFVFALKMRIDMRVRFSSKGWCCFAFLNTSLFTCLSFDTISFVPSPLSFGQQSTPPYPGKHPLVTHVLLFQTACRMTSRWSVVAWPVSAKKQSYTTGLDFVAHET